ncbi:hypothetical protein D3C81_1347020 [compost metagenome]
MCPHQDVFCNVKGILHIAGWVILRQVEGLKVVIIGLYFRTFRNAVSKSNEDILNVLNDLIQGMNTALAKRASR